MSGGGWTVADTAQVSSLSRQPKRQQQQLPIATPTNTQEYDSDQHQSRAEPAKGNNNGANHHHHVRWSDRSKSEEDLDKLLDGLDKLTETLPDLGGSAGDRVDYAKQDSKPKTTQLYAVVDKTNGHHSANVNRGEQQYEEETPPPRPPLPSALDQEQSSAFQQQQHPPPSSTSHTRAPSLRRQERVDKSEQSFERQQQREDEKVAFPSVRKTRQLLQSRDTYNDSSVCSDYGETNSNSMEGGGGATSSAGPRQPYHTMENSKPFSYIRTNSGSRGPSRNLSRASSREALNNMQAGLESPSLLRKIMGVSNNQNRDRSLSPEIKTSTATITPQFISNNNNNVEKEQVIPIRFSSTPSKPAAQQPTSKGFHHQDQQVSSYTTSSRQVSDEEASLTWLERQQRKLEERRDVDRRRGPRAQQEMTMMNDLKTSLHQARSETTTDGYASDVPSMLYSETSTRESSPHKQMQQKSVYNIPVKVETTGYNNTVQQQQQRQQAQEITFTSSSANNGFSSNGQSNNIYSNGHPSPRPNYNNGQPSPRTNIISNDQMQQQQQQQQQAAYVSRHYHYASTPKNSASDPNSFYNRSLARQNSDRSYDRSRPFINRRLRYDSESESELCSDLFSRGRANGLHGSNTSIDSALHWGSTYSQGGSRPVTPGFPSVPGTPHFNQSTNTMGRSSSLSRAAANGYGSHHRSASPAGSLYQQSLERGSSRRGSVSSEPADVSPVHVRLVKDNFKFWYKPNISREDAIAMLKHRPPGTFVVRDSNSFPGAFGLALKVATPPANAQKASDPSTELVRHFLIEPTSKGVKLKGYSNEPVFGSLSALVYQHTITQLALPTRLVLPQSELSTSGRDSVDSRTSTSSQMQQLLALGAACNVTYLLTMDMDTLTGPAAVKKAVTQLLTSRSVVPSALLVHFKVSGQGITLTDTARKRFFRKHFNTPAISFCGVDPDDRRWQSAKKDAATPVDSKRIFGFVARKTTSRNQNQCHLFAESDPEQPARAIVNFVNKVMLTGNNARADVV